MKPKFALAGTLTNATTSDGWSTAQLTLNVVDREGIYLLSDVLVADRVLIDVGAADGGLVAMYNVTAIESRVGTTLVVAATYVVEAGVSTPDLSWCIGSAVAVSRVTDGVFPVIPPGVQGLADKLSFSMLNAGLGATATSAGSATTAASAATSTATNASAAAAAAATSAAAAAAAAAAAGAGAVAASGVHYLIVLGAGQSNASGRGGARDARIDVLNDRVYTCDAAGTYAGKIVQAMDPLGSSDAAIGASVSMSFLTTFARDLADALPVGQRVLIVPTGYGGLGIDSWNAGGQMDVECKRALNAAIAAITAQGATYEISCILWHQGESDTTDALGAAYASKLSALVSRMRTTYPGGFSDTTPFVCGGLMAEFVASPTGGTVAGAAAVMDALRNLPTLVAHTAMVEAPATGYAADAYHFNAAGQRIFGHRYFAGLVSARANASPSGATPTAPTISTAPVVSAAVVGTPVTWSAAVVHGTPTPTVVYDVLIGGAVVAAGATSGSYTPSTAGGSLTVRATATNSEGSVQATSPAVTITAAPTAPSQPTGLTSTAVTSTSVTLSFVAPASNGGAAISDYVVQFSSDAGATWTTFLDGTSTALSITVTGLTASHPYVFKVAAVNSVGTSAYSGTYSVSTTAAATGFADTFDRAVSTTGLGTTDTGAKTWTQNGVFGINSSGQAYRVSAATDNYRSHASAPHGLASGGTITLSITAAGNYATGVVLVQDDNNLVIVTDEGEVYRWISGAWGGTSWGTYTARTATPSTASPETLVVTWSASSITVTRNGTLISTITDAAIVAAAMASVRAGIWSNNGTNTFNSITVTA